MAKVSLVGKKQENKVNDQTEQQFPVATVGNNLPAVVTQGVMDVQLTGGGTPYVVFLNPKSSKYGDILQAIPGAKEADTILVRPAPHVPVKLSPLKFFLVSAQQFWAQLDNSNNILSATFERPDGTGPKLEELVETVILAIQDGKVYPARMTFRSTKAPAVQQVSEAVRQAGTPKWADRGEAYKVSMGAPYPWMRVLATVTTTPRTSRSSGNRYHQAVARIEPSTPNEWLLLGQFFSDESGTALLRACHEQFNRRIADVRETAEKGV